MLVYNIMLRWLGTLRIGMPIGTLFKLSIAIGIPPFIHLVRTRGTGRWRETKIG